MKKTKFFCLFAAALLGVSGAIAGASNAFETGLEPTAIQKNAADDEAALVAAQARFYALVEEAGQLAMKDIPQEYKEMLLAACDANIETLEACYAAIENLETLIEAIKAMLNENETEYVNLKTWNFRDANQFPKDARVEVASLTIEYDTVPGGIMLYQSTNPLWDGLAFEPAKNDGTQSWWLRPRNAGTDYGLAAINQTRWFAVLALHAGYKVTVESKAAMLMADSTMVAEIVKNEKSECGYGVSYTYTMAKDGILAFQNAGNYMYKISIDAPIVARYKALDMNFRDANQFPKDARVEVASLTIEYDTVPGGIMLYQSTNPLWDGLVFEPAKNDGTQSWWLRPRNAGTDYGLAAINQTRWFAVKDLKAGAKVTVQSKGAMLMADSTIVSEIVKNEKTDCGYGVSYTYTMAKPGMLAFQNAGNYMYRITVEQPVNYMVETVRNFRDAEQFPIDSRVTVASLTIEYDTVPDGTKLFRSTDPLWDGLVFQPAANDAANSWWLRRRNTGTDYGLARINGTAWFAIADLKAGETVTVESKAAMLMADSTIVSEIVKNEKSECGYGVSYTYTMAKDGFLAFQQNGVYMYRIITNQYGGLDAGTPAPAINEEGNDWGAKLVTLTCEAEDATISYTLDNGEAIAYTAPFYLTSTTTVAATAELNGVASATTYKSVVAGNISAPTVTAIASKDAERTVVIASATAAAYLDINGVEVANNDTVVISETTKYTVIAKTKTEVTDTTFVLSSDTTVVTIEAGKPLQLNPVSVVKVSDNAEEWVFVVDNSSADIIGQPETQISYEVYPSGEKADVAHGDTLTFATHKRISLVADAEGYATSEPTVVWTREPAQLELVWEDDFKTNAEQTLDGGNYTVVLQPTTFSAEGTDFCPVQVSDDYISNANFGVQSGTNWLQRNVNGYIGLYNYNSGPRRIGINNLRKTQVVKFTVQDPAQVSLVNDVLQLDETNSTANTLYYNCVKDGAAVLSMSRYYCIWKVEVYNNPDVTASPNVYIAGMNEDKSRQVAVVPAEVAYPKNQFTFYALANGTHKDSTMVVNEADTTYSYFDVQDYTDFAPFEEIFSVSKPNNIVLAYAEYEGKKSEIAEVTIDCDSIYSLIDPTISWIEKGEAGHSFTIANRNLIEAGLYPVLKFAYGEDIVDLYGEKVDIDAKGSGWMTVQAVLPGMDTTYVVSRYVAEAREAYDAAYFSVMNGDTLTLSGSMGEFEAAAGAVVSGKYPEKNIAVTGVQYIHQAVTSNYTAMTMPFALNPSVNVITDAAGHKLTFGEDYEILTLHNNTNANVNTGKNAENVISVSNIEACKRTTSMAAGTPILFRALTEKVGSEIIVQSQAKAAVTVAATATTQPTGWKIFGNKQFLSVALEGGAYVLNEEGKKFVWTENPTVGSLGVVIMADAAIKAVLGNEIDLSATTAIEEIATELDELPVYDLQGMKVENAKAGQIYIMGGKRILNK